MLEEILEEINGDFFFYNNMSLIAQPLLKANIFTDNRHVSVWLNHN